MTIEELLAPLDIVRSTLPPDVAEQVAAMEARIAELEQTGLTGETREAQDAALDEAITLAEQGVAIREAHQGNGPGRTRWRSPQGHSATWYQILDTRWRLQTLRITRAQDELERKQRIELQHLGAQIEAMYEEGRFEECSGLIEVQLNLRLFGPEHPDVYASRNNLGIMLDLLGQRLAAAEQYRIALEGRLRSLGEDHPRTLMTISNIGVVQDLLGNLAEAEFQYRTALIGRARLLGGR